MKYTYQRLVELVGGDEELVAQLVERGEIREIEGDRALVNVERVMVARTLHRELEVDYNGIEVILRLRDELAAARARIASLEEELRRKG